MAKKNFKGGFDALLGEENHAPKPDDKKKTKRVLTTIVTDEETLQKIKGIAYWERLKMKDILNTAFKEYINKYESTKGVIKPVSKDNN